MYTERDSLGFFQTKQFFRKTQKKSSDGEYLSFFRSIEYAVMLGQNERNVYKLYTIIKKGQNFRFSFQKKDL